MRLTSLLLFAFLSCCQAAVIPEELRIALASFRTEGPFGWGFTQTTSDGTEAVVESFDPSQAAPFQWSLVQKNGAPPTEEERREYQQTKLVRTSALNAPRLERQLDLNSCELRSSDEKRLSCAFRLNPGEQHDQAYENLTVLITLDRPTGTIIAVEISSLQPFNPVFGIRIQESRTLLTYSLPEGELPSFLLSADITVLGRAFWIKSMDQKMKIRWTDHKLTRQRRK